MNPATNNAPAAPCLARHPGRELWRPKFPEVAAQCASCPFRVGNNKEFGEVVARLRKAEGIPGEPSKKDVGFARISLLMETENSGDFICHCTAYDGQMKQRPMSDFRQCRGATRFFKTGELTPKAE